MAVALLLLHPAQLLFYFAASQLKVFLFLAAFMDFFSRTAELIMGLYEDKNMEGVAGLELISVKTIQGLFLSNYGGLLLVPVWFGLFDFRNAI